MNKPKIYDCITFYNENFLTNLRFEILNEAVDHFVICESKYDHRGNQKKLNFNIEKYSNDKKIKYLVLEERFPKNNNPSFAMLDQVLPQCHLAHSQINLA